MRFLRLAIAVLTVRGDLKQLRWLFQSALGDAAFQLAGGGSGIALESMNRSNFLSIVAANLVTSGLADLNSGGRKSASSSSAAAAAAAAAGGAAPVERPLKDQLELWDEYLKVSPRALQ